jgi:hypothetical protein
MVLNQRFEGEPLLKHRTRRKLLIAAPEPQCYYSTTGMDKQLRVANLIRKSDKSSGDIHDEVEWLKPNHMI